jgi:hypothetical protein
MSDRSGGAKKGGRGGGSDSSPCISNGSSRSKVPLKGATGVYMSNSKKQQQQHRSSSAAGGRRPGRLGLQWWGGDSGSSYAAAKPSSSAAPAAATHRRESAATSSSSSVWFEHWHTKLFILWVFFMALVSLSVYLKMNAETVVRRRETLANMCEGRARMLEVHIQINTVGLSPSLPPAPMSQMVEELAHTSTYIHIHTHTFFCNAGLMKQWQCFQKM